jgi:hypothetical protein
MARRQAVPVTPLGQALERHRLLRKMTKAEASEAAGFKNHVLWNRLLTVSRKYDPDLIKRAAEAVGLDLLEALRLAKVAIVPNDTCRVMTFSEVLALQNAS